MAVKDWTPIIEVEPMVVKGWNPIIEVEREAGVWWSMPLELSSALYQAHEKTLMTEFTFVWDWQNPFWNGSGKTQGSYEVDGEKTQYSRYRLCFNTMTQTNIDSGRVRSFRVVFMKREDAWILMS